MATNVIMPALGMAQEKGRLIRWLVEPGAAVNKGDPLMEVETDKATVEIEATASGILTHVTAAAGDEVPVTQVIAVIVAPGEVSVTARAASAPAETTAIPQMQPALPPNGTPAASPVAVRVAAEHGVDLRLVVPQGARVEKADVLAYIEAHEKANPPVSSQRVLASPKARRLAAEEGLALTAMRGTGPEGAVQVADVLAAVTQPAAVSLAAVAASPRLPVRTCSGAITGRHGVGEHPLARDGRAHDAVLDHGAALLPLARGQRRGPHRLAHQAAATVGRQDHLHRSPDQGRRGGVGQAPAR